MKDLKPKIIEKISLIKPNQLSFSTHLSNLSSTIVTTTSSSNSIPDKKSVWIEGYGCSANMADSEIISGLLKNEGYLIAKNENEASMHVIVTCSVKDNTEHKMLNRISELSDFHKPLIVAGCMTKTERAKIERINPNASLLGPDSISETAKIANATINGIKNIFLDRSLLQEKVNLPRIRLNPVVGIVEIASGCLSDCSFCQTKIAKGQIHSYRLGDIKRQIENDILDGCKEIWLTSTDNGAYGLDIQTNVVELLKNCLEIKGEFKIRLGMLNPMFIHNFLDELIEILDKNEKLFKFLHIPIQSGSDRILQKMQRGYTSNFIKNTVNKIRTRIPELTLATDVIVGFPTETEEDFLHTMDLIKIIEPDIVNISKYSSRSGTKSSKLKKVDSRVVKSRSHRLHLTCETIFKRRNEIWKNWIGDIIVDEIQNTTSSIIGRNYAYKSIILDNSNLNSDSNNISIKLGDKTTVKIIGSSKYSLVGNIITD